MEKRTIKRERSVYVCVCEIKFQVQIKLQQLKMRNFLAKDIQMEKKICCYEDATKLLRIEL